MGQLLAYKVNGQRVIHCFDPSHLIKTVRNNFQTKNVAHFISKRWRTNDTTGIGPLQIASWDHIVELYQMDLKSAQRRLPKLSAEHLKPSKLKMKVSLATEIFSNTCGSFMLKCIKQKKLPEDFSDTAQLLLFMNDVFDSMNGSEDEKDGSLKAAVTENSEHKAFWDHAVSVLSNMYFIDKVTGEVDSRSSVLKKMESTLKGYIEFTKICFDVNIPKVSIRYHVRILKHLLLIIYNILNSMDKYFSYVLVLKFCTERHFTPGVYSVLNFVCWILENRILIS